MNESERRARLIEWLEIILKEVQDLLLDDHIFWEFQKLVEANPKFKQSPGLFTQWMASSFIQATATGVRRQAKINDESISLARFLAEVERYPNLVSRAHYMSLHDGKESRHVEIGKHDFDTVAGAGAAHLSTDLIRQHIAKLKTAVDGIEHYVDRRIAHYDKRGLAKPTPTFVELTDALATLEKLVILYWRLLKGASYTNLLPTILFDWQQIFRFVWVPR
jgi:AbiU2